MFSEVYVNSDRELLWIEAHRYLPVLLREGRRGRRDPVADAAQPSPLRTACFSPCAKTYLNDAWVQHTP